MMTLEVFLVVAENDGVGITSQRRIEMNRELVSEFGATSLQDNKRVICTWQVQARQIPRLWDGISSLLFAFVRDGDDGRWRGERRRRGRPEEIHGTCEGSENIEQTSGCSRAERECAVSASASLCYASVGRVSALVVHDVERHVRMTGRRRYPSLLLLCIYICILNGTYRPEDNNKDNKICGFPHVS